MFLSTLDEKFSFISNFNEVMPYKCDYL